MRRRPGIASHHHRRAPRIRTGSTSAALCAERRSLLRRGVASVLGSFLLYALASCFVPQVLTSPVGPRFQVGELAPAAQVVVIVLGVSLHDRRARRHVDPLARRVTRREREGHNGQLGGTRAVAAEQGQGRGGFGDAPFNAFDRSRAFGERAAL